MGKKKDRVYLGACLSPAARRDLKQPAVRRRQLLPSRKPSKTSTPCAARRAHKKDLSQVNPQLYEWLATVNERSNGTLATPSGEQAPTIRPKRAVVRIPLIVYRKIGEMSTRDRKKAKKAGEFFAAQDRVRER